jgi:fatty acid desaturase
MSSSRKRPKLPPELYEKSLLGSAGLIGTMLAFFVGGGAINSWIWLHSTLPVAAKVLVSAPVFLVAGQGIHLMGWIGHDGLHFNLSKSRHWSAGIGIFFSAMTALFVEMGMALDHWTHHRFTNTSKDPDLKLFEKHRTFLARMVFTRLRANRLYVRRVARLVLGLPLDEDVSQIVFPLGVSVLRAYAAFNLACIAFWWVVYIAIGILDYRIAIVGFLIPTAVANVVSGLRPYIEHNGTGVDEWYNTRTRTSLLWTYLDVGANYHLEHHLYPGVPQWRLPKLHRFLKSQGFYDDRCHIDSTFLGNYRFAFGDYVYPDGDIPDGHEMPEAAMY